MIFRDDPPSKPRKKYKRRWRILFPKVGELLLLLIAVILGGVLGAVIYDEFLTKREINKVKQSVENLRQEFLNVSPRNVARNVSGNGIAKKITDNSGNIFDVFIVDLNKSPVAIYYKDNGGNRIGNFERLKEYLEGQSEELIFATNGGMYTSEGGPVGLLVTDSKVQNPLDLKDGGSEGNFYLKPNGVFAITGKEAVIMESTRFNDWAGKERVNYATQSGPMLIIDGKVHPKFRKDSSNKVVRSGVGIINSSQVVFAISEKGVTFYDFAMLFQQQLKCNNALYLDGVVSRMYLPALERNDLEGDFGSIIAVSK